MESLFGIEFQFWKRSPFFHDICHTEYLGPMEETSTPIKLGFHCQVVPMMYYRSGSFITPSCVLIIWISSFVFLI